MNIESNKTIGRSLAGTGNRIMQVDEDGLESATEPIITGKLSDVTAIILLTNATNWNSLGAYIGTAITGTFEGQYYSDSIYYFYAYSDNAWIRKTITLQSTISSTFVLTGLGGKVALFYDSATGESGLACLEIAREALVKGNTTCYLIGGTSGKVSKVPTSGASHSMPAGVALTAASGDGATFWNAKTGLVQVLPESGVTAAMGNVIVSSTNEAGKVAQYSTVPTSDHWDELGHWTQTGSGAGVLTLASIHFN